jgi:uncharacterized pyridoxal phosphate-containing UPF0001 family protein
MSIAENVDAVRARIKAAAAEAGRGPEEIKLVAASKMNGADRVREAVRAGVHACGENRVQEFLEKRAQGAYEGATAHLIGHLQKNKVKQAAGAFDLIESVDSEELLVLLDRRAAFLGIVQDVLVEINIAGEESNPAVPPALPVSGNGGRPFQRPGESAHAFRAISLDSGGNRGLFCPYARAFC